MIYEKKRIAPLPFKIKFSLRRRHWYIFPQGWTHTSSVADIGYKADGNIYEHRYFWLVTKYTFTWLFFTINFELKMTKNTTSTVRHEPVRYANSEGELFKAW